MWHFRSKYQRIRILVKNSCKRLKVVLALGVKKLASTFLSLTLNKFSLFNKFLDLGVFQDLDNFWDLDNFSDFLTSFLLLLVLNLIIKPLLLFFLKTSLSANLVVFNIEISEATILLNPLINYQ